MRQPLDKALRKKLEDTVIKARDIVEAAVKESLQRLGVADSQAPSYLKDNEKILRNKLRAHARQLGDRLLDGKQEITRLANEMAYEHWHRMLFARFLEQSNLLMYDPQTPVTLDECFELAEEEDDCKDGWELAGRLAQKMLPQIFRADSPVFEVKLSMNRVDELEGLISKLDPQTYQAQDSLGWCYQFWQTKKKEEVNKSGVKIGAQELSPVTQLFTEPYMVSFLLDNALGAWWANKRLSQDDLIRANNEQELRDLASIPGVPLEYLRFTKNKKTKGTGAWTPAAGKFEKWPEHLSELKTLDPCCGSGHFLVAVFLMLVPMRMQLEGLTERQAVDAVIRDNIHGLELDQRCVELAAFALALEAWRYPNTGGYRVLPELQLACSGMSIAEAQKEWRGLTKDDEKLQGAIKWMQETFKNAPTLGSLIEPNISLLEDEQKPWKRLQEAIRKREAISNEAKAIAQGLVKTADLLTNEYCWVITNVPYLTRGRQHTDLIGFCNKNYAEAKHDLATVFLEKCLELTSRGGFSSVVLTQNWLFLSSYSSFRKKLLKSKNFNLLSRLGGGAEAFDDGPGNITNIALIGIENFRTNEQLIKVIDALSGKTPLTKSQLLKSESVITIKQDAQLSNPGSVISFQELNKLTLLSEDATCIEGLSSGDSPQFVQKFWEVNDTENWVPFIQNTNLNKHYSGRTDYILWEGNSGRLKQFPSAHNLPSPSMNGFKVLGNKGVRITQMGKLRATLYNGEIFGKSGGTLIHSNNDVLPAIWCLCSSSEYDHIVREIDQKISVTVGSMIKIPFDLKKWGKVAEEKYPYGLPQPYTDDPTQWIFHGHPCSSVIWDEEAKVTAVGKLRQDESVLQVAVARLLGYQWPAELDPEMELAPEMREVMKKNDEFANLVDDDGIVCIPAVRGEKSAAKRLEAMLLKAYGDKWNNSVETSLLKAVKAKDLEGWLRDKFFEQHCKLFQHRPFIWHIWDGLKDGFSALVNYHQLDYKGLERLIYTYLDDWISNQKRQLAEGTDGADIRLTAAENLKIQLEAILAGEEGLDIFVRWKPLEEQPIGWNPDLNDGVRLNIRPFMLAKDVGKKGAGVLRAKPNIHWKKDRGTDVESAPWYNLGLEYGGKQGDRINEHHLSLSVKREARMKLKEAD